MAPHKTYTIQSAHYIHTSGLSSPYCHITPSVSDGHTGSCAYFVRSLLLLGLFSTIDSFTDYTHVSLQEDLIIDQIISIAFKWKASYSALQLSFQFFGIEAIIKLALLSYTSETFLILQGPHCFLVYTIGPRQFAKNEIAYCSQACLKYEKRASAIK
jgi:hypothetical protein